MWAGGKTQLIPTLTRRLPDMSGTYYEPFLGGGALFFYLRRHRLIQDAILSDSNQELITTYRYLQNGKFPDLIRLLAEYQRHFREDSQFFYHVRKQQPTTSLTIAARIIFLNRTCYRGLFRVNKDGEFNVPIGKKKKQDIVRNRFLSTVASALQHEGTAITKGDFANIAKSAAPGDFIYFDPPYMPITSKGNFVGYTADGFTGDDWYRLVDLVQELHKDRVHIMISQSFSRPVRSAFENKEGWNIEVVNTDHIIGKREGYNQKRREVIIRSFWICDLVATDAKDIRRIKAQVLVRIGTAATAI